MSYITPLIKNKTIDEIINVYTKAPYFLQVKQDSESFMMLFTEKSDLTLVEVRDCTGIIFEKGTNNLLHFSFPKCYEQFTLIETEGTERTERTERTEETKESKEFKEYKEYKDSFPIELLGKNSKVNLFFVGSMIKLYYVGGKWKISSSKNLDGENSFWSCKKSFVELFTEAIENSYDIKYFDFIEKLDVNFCYTYLIQYKENCTPIKVDMSFAFLLNKVNTTTLEEIIPDIDNFAIEKSPLELFKNCNTAKINENYLVFDMDTDGKVKNRIKIISSEFTAKNKLFGNYQNIGLKYIECVLQDLQNGNNILTDELKLNLPEYNSIFRKIDILFVKACNCILKSYANVYTNNSRSFDNIPKSHIKILKKLQELNKPQLYISDVRDYLINLKNIKQVAYIIVYIY
jgi:hypothetical protein